MSARSALTTRGGGLWRPSLPPAPSSAANWRRRCATYAASPRSGSWTTTTWNTPFTSVRSSTSSTVTRREVGGRRDPAHDRGQPERRGGLAQRRRRRHAGVGPGDVRRRRRDGEERGL